MRAQAIQNSEVFGGAARPTGRAQDNPIAQACDKVVALYGTRPGVRRKSVDQRCALVSALGQLGETVADAMTVYRKLGEIGQPLSMSQVYRGLQALADEGLLASYWLLEDGRPRRGYTLQHDDA